MGDLGLLDYFFFFETPFRSTGNKSYFEFTGCMAAFQSFFNEEPTKLKQIPVKVTMSASPLAFYHCKKQQKGKISNMSWCK